MSRNISRISSRGFRLNSRFSESPQKGRFRRSLSRERIRKNSPIRSRLPVHERLSTKASRSIERKNYDSDDHFSRRNRRSRSNSKISRNSRKSRSPKRRSKSPRRSRSRSKRRSRYSRSRSKEKFTFSSDYNTNYIPSGLKEIYSENIIDNYNLYPNYISNENGNFVKNERLFENLGHERRNCVDYNDQEISLIDSHNSLMDNFYNNNIETNLDYNHKINLINERPIRERIDMNPQISSIETDTFSYYSKHKDFSNNYFQNQDVDLRNSNIFNYKNEPTFMNYQEKDEIKKCPNHYLGCIFTANEDLINQHLIDCGYNPKNINSYCSKCKLNVPIGHSCIDELKSKIYSERCKTTFFQNTIKLTNSSLINELTQQFIFVHYNTVTKKIRVVKTDKMDYITKQAVEAFFSKEELFRLNKTDRDFQLVCSGLNIFSPEVSFNKSLKLQIPATEEIHLQLIDKELNLKVSIKNLFHENEKIIVAVPDIIPLTIDQTKRIIDFKKMIIEKSKSNIQRLLINGKEFNDHQLLLCIGLTSTDHIEIET